MQHVSGGQFAIEISLLHGSLGRRPQGSNTEYVDSSTVTIFLPQLAASTKGQLRESRAARAEPEAPLKSVAQRAALAVICSLCLSQNGLIRSSTTNITNANTITTTNSHTTTIITSTTTTTTTTTTTNTTTTITSSSITINALLGSSIR